MGVTSSGSRRAQRELLRVEDLGFTYGDGREVLADIGFRLGRGEVLALWGRSGSGKSTLLNLLSGIDTPGRGRILFDGTNLTALDDRERTLFRRHHMGFVYQFFNLVQTLTAAENVALVLELNGVPAPEGRRRARDMLTAVGLEGRGERYPDQLSGGEQQRVAMARALVHEPALVLADEPTGNLDARTGGQVMDLLRGAVRERDASLILVSHSRELVDLADRILVLEDGRLAPEATPS